MGAEQLNTQYWFALSAGPAALFLYGLFAALESTPGTVLAACAVASSAAMWCTVDSLRRQRYWHRSAQLYTFIAWPVAVPVYLVWSRGKRGIWLALVWVLSLFVFPLLGAIAAGVVSAVT